MNRTESSINKKINKLDVTQSKISAQIKEVKNQIKPVNQRSYAMYKKRELLLRKAIVKPSFDKKTVLTDSHWHYIELLLRSGKEKNCEEALNYWNQAKNFYLATQELDLVSKPLTTYYCFLNATKALLTYKNVKFDPKHGISGQRQKGQVKLQNEFVKLHKKGVLAGLSNYLNQPIKIDQDNKNFFANKQIPIISKEVFLKIKEHIISGDEQEFNRKLTSYLENKKKTESKPEVYTLKDLLYNLEYVHRAYKLTFPSDTELFIPILNPRFVTDKKSGWLEFQLESEYSKKRVLNHFSDFELDEHYGLNTCYLKTKEKFNWVTSSKAKNYNDFLNYYHKYRNAFVYIYSTNELWYYKRNDLKSRIIFKNSMVLTLASMHRLSEMSRYDPNTLSAHLDSKHGWLLSEFINKSIYQFVDMISSEISGDDFRATGFRN
ncbi:YaaC family protein [Exiguobacterium sp. s143]|uniref:YaaC family protein n=1 Tax=Exiguobacterium sp. s143 TaxID=2751201 RepID=UPI001BECEAF5|nr:YaaC family protein [Exiguobacterium sp. s143]